MRRFIITMLSSLALIVVVACGSDDAVLSGFERTPTPVVNDYALPIADPSADPFNLNAAQASDLLVVYFGYTNCPDVCPTTLFDLRTAIDALDEEDRDRVQTAMITIDPNRDTNEILSGYVGSFLPDATALRTEDDAELRRVADLFGADYGVTETEDGEIEVLHTGSLYAVNRSGELLVSWPFGVPATDVAKDLRILLDRESV